MLNRTVCRACRIAKWGDQILDSSFVAIHSELKHKTVWECPAKIGYLTNILVGSNDTFPEKCDHRLEHAVADANGVFCA